MKKFAATSALLVGLATTVAGQGLSNLPECAQGCANGAIPEDCGMDPECICSADEFIAAITCCVADSCSEDDQEASIEYANGICGGVGIDIPQSAVCTTGTASETASETATETDSPAASTPAPTTMGSITGSGSPTTGTGSVTTSGSDSGSATESAPESTGTNMAAPLNADGGALAAFAAAVVAFA